MTSERRDDEKRDRRVEVQTCGPDSILANHERAQGPVNKTKARALTPRPLMHAVYSLYLWYCTLLKREAVVNARHQLGIEWFYR